MITAESNPASLTAVRKVRPSEMAVTFLVTTFVATETMNE
jgi:hypothetical protein